MQSMMVKGVKGFLADAGPVILSGVLGCLVVVALAVVTVSVLITAELLLGRGSDAASLPVQIRYGAYCVTCLAAGMGGWWLVPRASRALKERGQQWELETERAAKASEARKRLAGRGAYTDPARNEAGGDHS